MPGTGYRVVVPYEEHKDCGDSSEIPAKRVCSSRVPVFVDLQLSHGLNRRIDVLADFRFGIERGHPGTRQFAFAPGLRYWLDPDTAAKAFTVLQAVYDATAQNQPGVSDSDFGGRVALGFMYDLMRNFGIYLQAGATAGFKRWFRVELDTGLGAQARFP